MPYLGRRLRENFLLFLAMGLVYYFLYHNAILPAGKFPMAISYAGVLIVALFIYVYFLHTYLVNVGDVRDYIVVNASAYIVYVVVYYITLMLYALVGGVFARIYALFFAPFNLFCVWGVNTALSALLVHIIYVAVIWIVPVFFWEKPMPYGDYFQEIDENL